MTDCIQTNTHGVEFTELTCVYPFLKPFYSDFELNYDPVSVLDWLVQWPVIPIAAISLYAIGIVAGKAYFKDRNPWNWRKGMAVWNFGLSLFSAIGFFRILPYLVHLVATKPIKYLFCTDPELSYGSGSTGLWIQLFILSKFPELFDTFFIVIHKKPLIFLHWYHHITVLLYCWHSYATKSPPGIFFVVMNYSVHASMYFYYFLMAMRARPKWLNPIIITAFQISQMIVGVAVTLVAFYYYLTDDTCMIEKENNTAAMVMYGSYLFLFLQFFVARYFKAQAASKKKKTA
mmetsp:Transcript_1961/g.3045  ORF Transcript_1961/g.3045 Transcript_1961/m.3045 type:complete len:289 (-) Transcript_1961:287-1153(-)